MKDKYMLVDSAFEHDWSFLKPVRRTWKDTAVDILVGLAIVAFFIILYYALAAMFPLVPIQQ